jgi:multiple sugar transport system substrate-binding protein
MDQLELSVIGDYYENLPELLDRFHRPCQIRQMDWDTAWEELVRIGLYRHGPDVSLVGTTWIDHLVTMNALRPFTAAEVEAIGGPTAFFPASWQTVRPARRDRVWSIPWLADVRVIFYWRDMLEQAGVDEKTAFQTPARLEETLTRLQASGIETPWGVWTLGLREALQLAASWVWGAGGDFVSADGKQILLNQPIARQGLVDYFGLYRYMVQGLRHVDDVDTQDLFIKRQLAAVIGPAGWLTGIYDQTQVLDASAMLGIASPPGPAFVGGSNLVVWQHARHNTQDAVELVRFLTSHEIQLALCQGTSQLSTRPDVLDKPPYATDLHYQALIEAVKTGRTYPVFPKWSLVEDKIGEAIIALWDIVLSDPEQDLEATITQYLDALARRLTVTLGLRM